MTPSSDRALRPSTRVDALKLLSGRLAAAGSLTVEMRDALRRGDAIAIEQRTDRLERLLTEVRVLVGEVERLAPPADAEEHGLAEARERFEATATALAREGAVSGGLLAGLVDRARRLFESSASYRSDGRPTELRRPTLDLKELA